MKKYIQIFKNHFQSYLEYRANLIGTVVLEFITLSSTVFLWFAIFQQEDNIKGYTFKDNLLYFLLISAVGFAVQVYASDQLAKDIRYGNLSNFLVKPYNIWISTFTESMAKKAVTLALIAPIYILAFSIYSYVFGLDLINGINTIVFLILTIAGFLLHFTLDMIIALTAFWITDIWSFKHLKRIAFSILGGISLPMEFLSGTIKSIFNFLPFKFFYYIPVSYILNKRSGIDDIKSDIQSLIVWTISFSTLCILLWKKGLKKYESFGN